MLNPNTLTQDLLNFIDELRTRFGYNIGLEQFITVQNLILALTAQGRLPAKLADLQTFLAPVLCHSLKEQEDFVLHFEKWVSRFETRIEVKSQPSSLEIELKSISRGMTFWKWTWRLVLVLMLILVPMELFKLNQDSSELKSPQVTKPIDETTTSSPAPEVVKPSGLPPETSKIAIPPSQPTLSQNIWESKWNIGLTLLLPLFLFLTWWLWWQYQVHRFLARKTVSTQPDLQQFLVQGHQHQLFSSVPLQRVAQGLRKHFTLPTSHLDVKTTLAKTIQAGGWFTPVMGTVQTSPEYLVLIDRTTFRDHQAEFINTLVKRLEAEEVFITRYYFDADPRRCYPEQPQLPPLTLPELAGRYPQHRLLIFTDGQGFIHPITGELAGWVTQLSDWSQRTLFTLEAQPQWGYREKLLEDEAGFLVLPANEKGLTVLVEYINEQRKADLASSPESPFPEMLIDRPRRYLERHAPEAETVTELLAQVRQFLGATGYDWFSACAVYPELRWQLTLYLGEALQVLNEERLAKLARLSWFRYGYMPNWLREKLVKDLSLAQEKEIREALQVLLLTAVEGGKGEFRLEVAREQQKGWLTLVKKLLPILSKTVDKRSALRDYIFLTFLADPLSVRVPKVVLEVMSKFVTSTQLPKLRWAMSMVMWVGVLGIVGSFLYVLGLPESSNLPEILNPQRGVFESAQEFQARRERLLAEFNQASSQGEARYQVGVASLKNYNAKAEKLFVTLEWQATWVKFLGLLKLGRVEMTSQVADSFWQNNSQKPLYVQVEVGGEQLKISRVVLTSDGQVWYITFPVLPEMVTIPAGQFRMGDIQGTGFADEQPVHAVSVKSFAMGRHEVTFEEYDYFAEQTGQEKPGDRGWGRGKRPVINVSWDGATAYAEWLSELTGESYRLPTEAEWEYAARAGTETDYWWGNEIGGNHANCDGCGSQWDNKLTAPVCSFVYNPFGLCDTVGNVWEWTCSEYEEKYSGKELECAGENDANKDGSSNNRANDGSLRVIRGGAWYYDPRWVRASTRGRNARADRGYDVGFRLARM